MSYTLNKKSIASEIAKNYELSQKVSQEIVDSIFEEMKECLMSGGTVDIAKFGKYEVTERKERTGVNPSTGEKIEIPASKAVKFKPSKTLKDSLK